MKDALLRNLEKLSASLAEHGKRLRKLEVKNDTGMIANDTIRPSIVTGVFALPIDYHNVQITWNKATDNIGISGYRIYRGGEMIAQVSGEVYNDYAVSPSSAYSYEILAIDYAGNESAARSLPAICYTPGGADTQSPTTPGTLTASSISSSSVTMTWTASTDNVGVAGYTLYKGGIPIAQPIVTSYTDGSVLPGSSYVYSVDAFDAAGNHSGQSSPVLVNIPNPPVSTTWYVSTTGTNTNTGSIDSPWSLDFALNGAAGGAIDPGHTVYIRGGTYQHTAVQVVEGLVGTSDNPILIKAFPGERVTMRNAWASTFNTWILQHVEYTYFYDLEFNMYQYDRNPEIVGGVNMSHVAESPAHSQAYVRFYNCKFHDSAGKAYTFVLNSLYSELNGCFFYYNGSSPSGPHTININSAAGKRKTIKNCVFIHNAANDINLYSGADANALQDVIIQDNFFVNTGSLYSTPNKSILVAGTVATPTNIIVSFNAIVNDQATNANSRSIQIGHIGGAGTPGSLNVDVASNGDDGRWNNSPTWSNTGTSQQVGVSSGPTYWNGYARFNNVTIPVGATITNAWIDGWVTNTEAAATCRMVVRADKSSANPTAPGDYTTCETRAKTTASVDWVKVNWTLGDQIQSPDLTSVIQEVVSQGTWASGNSILLYLEENDANHSTHDIWIAALENSTYDPPTFHVEWTTAGSDGGANNVDGEQNVIVGHPLDLAGASYSGVDWINNTVTTNGAINIGNTESVFTNNTFHHTIPTTNYTVICHTYDWDNKKANILVVNWSSATVCHLSPTYMDGLNINTGDSYELHNIENYYSDVVTGIYNGVTIPLPMTGRSQANIQGLLNNPDTIYPNTGMFHIIVSGGSTPPPTTDTTAPTVPTNLVATKAGTNRIDLTWTASTDAVGVTGYQVFRAGVAIGTTSVNSYSNTGLSPNTNYTYTVKAYDAAGNYSAESASANATTDPIATSDTQAPTVPSIINVVVGVDPVHELYITWNASTDNVGVTGYTVYRNGTQLATGIASTNFTDTSCEASTTYSYTVDAYDAAGNHSAKSTAKTGTTNDPPPPVVGDTTPPSQVVGLTATAVSQTTINLTWTAATDNVAVTGYKVYRGATLKATLGNVTNYSDNTCVASTTYSYQVSALDAAGNEGTKSTASTATTSAPPSTTGYHVTTSGSSSGSGSSSSPWDIRTALTGASGKIQPGDVVWVHGGTYTLTSSVSISIDGSSGNPIQFKAYPGEVPNIRNNYDGASLNFTSATYLSFYDIVFSGYDYTRTNQGPNGTSEMSLIMVNNTSASNIKFYGCHFKNSYCHGVRAYYQAGGFEMNGCIVQFNGQNNDYDHGVYMRNENGKSKLIRDCVVCHNASHGIHMWGGGNYQEDDTDFTGVIAFQNGSLYEDSPTRQMLVAGAGGSSSSLTSENCSMTYCMVYTNLGHDTNGQAVKIGYDNPLTGLVMTNNVIVGSSVDIANSSGHTISNNKLYYGSSHENSTSSYMNAGSGNTLSSAPTSGSLVQVRSYNWDTRRGNIAIYNWASASSITITHATLVAAGITIANGDRYELHNAENFFGDVISGTYNGVSITAPMTGRTVETPLGGLPKPKTAFPKFGCFVLRTFD